METLIKLTLRELQAKIEEILPTLNVCGWEGLPLECVSVTHGSVVKFLIKEWEFIKTGKVRQEESSSCVVKDATLIAIAYEQDSSNNYSRYRDTLEIQCEPSKFGTIVRLIATYNEFQGTGSYSGQCSHIDRTVIWDYLVA